LAHRAGPEPGNSPDAAVRARPQHFRANLSFGADAALSADSAIEPSRVGGDRHISRRVSICKYFAWRSRVGAGVPTRIYCLP
jgi:hypothetical protein